jgi:tRNA(Ser,Leu) C12 N-acetylase TAN1
MKELERLIHFHFVETWKGDKAPTYALECKARNNDSLTQKDVLPVLDELIKSLTPLSRVNLSSPDLSLLVNVLQRNVFLSCVRGYHSRRKFSTRKSVDDQSKVKHELSGGEKLEV